MSVCVVQVLGTRVMNDNRAKAIDERASAAAAPSISRQSSLRSPPQEEASRVAQIQQHFCFPSIASTKLFVLSSRPPPRQPACLTDHRAPAPRPRRFIQPIQTAQCLASSSLPPPLFPTNSIISKAQPASVPFVSSFVHLLNLPMSTHRSSRLLSMRTATALCLLLGSLSYSSGT